MNKSLLSQVLDGAAFPAIMIAIAVSPINVSPLQRDAIQIGKTVTAEVRASDGDEKKAKGAEAQ